MAQIRINLPEPVARHCVAAVVEDDRLTLFADSSVWASRLRYQSQDLLGKLPEYCNLKGGLRVRVLLSANSPRRSSRHKARRLSHNSARLLNQVADGISDPDLKDALRRLSRHEEGRG